MVVSCRPTRPRWTPDLPRGAGAPHRRLPATSQRAPGEGRPHSPLGGHPDLPQGVHRGGDGDRPSGSSSRDTVTYCYEARPSALARWGQVKPVLVGSRQAVIAKWRWSRSRERYSLRRRAWRGTGGRKWQRRARLLLADPPSPLCPNIQMGNQRNSPPSGPDPMRAWPPSTLPGSGVGRSITDPPRWPGVRQRRIGAGTAGPGASGRLPLPRQATPRHQRSQPDAPRCHASPHRCHRTPIHGRQ